MNRFLFCEHAGPDEQRSYATYIIGYNILLLEEEELHKDKLQVRIK
jgi:hypothetical protein